MKSKKVFVLVSALALLLGACHNGGNKDTSSANTATSAPDTQVTTSEPSQSSQSGEIAVTALALNKATLSLEAGKSETLSVTVTPDNASNTKVTWDSDNKEVATVSSLGKVSALKVGTAKITVKSQSNPNVTAQCVVTVTEEGGKYGSVNKPKTVTEILAIAAQECKNDQDKTTDVVYVKGIVTKAPTYVADKGYSSNIYLKDALTDADDKELWVYSANHEATKTPYQNDEVVLHGYLMNYGGKIEITNVEISGKKIYPEIDAVTRGTSTITYNIEHGAVNAEAPKSAKNNAEFQFSITPEQGYKVDRVTVAGDEVTAENGVYKAYVKGNTVVNIDISREGVEIKTAVMAYPATDAASTNMVEGNNAATVGLDPEVFNVESTNTTSIYAGLNKAGEIRLYDNRKATDPEQITNGTTLTVSSRKVTITKIVIELTSASEGDMEVKAGNQVVTGNEGAYQIDNAQFSIQNVSRIIFNQEDNDGKGTSGKQVIIKKVTISYSENADVPATALAVSPKTLTLKPEQSAVLTAALEPANSTDTVSWKSSDATKATVDATGRVTAVAQGNVTITAYVDADKNGEVGENEIKDTAAVTVEAAETINYGTQEAPLTIAEAKAVLDKTGTSESKQPLFVKGIVSTNTKYDSGYGNYSEIWLQSDDGTEAKAFELFRAKASDEITTAYADANSLAGCEVVAKGFGKIYSNTYELTTSGNEPKNPMVLSVVPPAATDPTEINLDKATATVNVGSTVTLKATLAPAGAVGTVVWKSSAEDKATVDAGVVTGVAEGNATITAFVDANKNGAYDDGELKAECAVTVEAAATEAKYSLIQLNSSNTDYKRNYDVTFADGKIWSIPGNQNLDDCLKIGGKLSENTDRALYSKSVYPSVASLSIKHGAKDTQITVNSLTLYVYNSAADAAEGDTSKAAETVVGTYADNETATFQPAAAGTKWENKYFRVVYNMISSAPSSNKGVRLLELKLVF